MEWLESTCPPPAGQGPADTGSSVDYDGSIIEINAMLSYRLFSFLTLGGGYALFSVDVKATTPDFRGEVRYKSDGPSLSAPVFF